MEKLINSFLVLIFCLVFSPSKGQQWPVLKADISVSPEVRQSFQNSGRLILHLTRKKEKEPRFGSEITIGKTALNWNPDKPLMISTNDRDMLRLGLDKLSEHPSDLYYYQVVYKQNVDDGQENVPGNLYSKVDSIVLTPNSKLNLTLDRLIPSFEIITHKFVKSVLSKVNCCPNFQEKIVILRLPCCFPQDISITRNDLTQFVTGLPD